LERLTDELGLRDHVLFHGDVDDRMLIRCYQQCDLFILPNRVVQGDFEGFGMVLVEAQACGKPVVAGASGGTAETMQVPDTGRIVDCETPDPLAEVILDLLRQPELRRRMGEAARQWVVSKLGWDALAKEAASLFGIRLPADTRQSIPAEAEALHRSC
jgi:phosphatidylinositol alpha-1,6-mannosyltransferase